jgi:hypothetical protein
MAKQSPFEKHLASLKGVRFTNKAGARAIVFTGGGGYVQEAGRNNVEIGTPGGSIHVQGTLEDVLATLAGEEPVPVADE